MPDDPPAGLKLVAWDDYRRAHAPDAPAQDTEADVFDAEASSDEDEADTAPCPGLHAALRAAAKPAFKLASYAPATARASAADLHRAIHVPTFALVRTPRKPAPTSPRKPRAPASPRAARKAAAAADPGEIPKRAAKVIELTLPPKKRPRTKTRTETKLDPDPKHKHKPVARRPLLPKVPNAA
jgi:hypothetical protein